MSELGQLIRALRKNRGWTQEQLGKKAIFGPYGRAKAINKGTINEIETGRQKSFRQDTIQRIAFALGFSYGELYRISKSEEWKSAGVIPKKLPYPEPEVPENLEELNVLRHLGITPADPSLIVQVPNLEHEIDPDGPLDLHTTTERSLRAFSIDVARSYQRPAVIRMSEGDESMYPVFWPGDALLVSRFDSEPISEIEQSGFYVAEIDGKAMVRQVEIDPTRQLLLLVAANPDRRRFPVHAVNPQDASLVLKASVVKIVDRWLYFRHFSGGRDDVSIDELQRLAIKLPAQRSLDEPSANPPSRVPFFYHERHTCIRGVPILRSVFGGGAPHRIEQEVAEEAWRKTIDLHLMEWPPTIQPLILEVAEKATNMVPAIKPGDFVVLDLTLHRRRLPQPGRIYAINDSGRGILAPMMLLNNTAFFLVSPEHPGDQVRRIAFDHTNASPALVSGVVTAVRDEATLEKVPERYRPGWEWWRERDPADVPKD